MFPSTRTIARLAVASAVGASIAPATALADDTPSPCDALKRIVAAAPGFSALAPEDGRAAALPYGDDAACSATHGSYQCTWTSRGGSSAEALQGVAADIASCLPDATHDQNSPSRQHFYLGARGQRTQIVVATAGANKLKLVVSGNK
ncbi:hypothetical protein AWB81_00017 [Caballeronia arationis]|jgi:hypothetical protein|uniref:hypothetical protein n=1 Tax=Caballeronia arationis TaxID=1777142 RepID=UPI00074CDCD6|nr:hypothetical protein [Caballeronia arationis]SAK41665.1 hypothetical protein AWB81_00017 [Caballeronia arationis]